MNSNTLLSAGLVADSLALAPHWIYDPAEIETKFGKIQGLLQPPAGSYHESEPLGGQTHYGHQAILLGTNDLGPDWNLDAFRVRLQQYWNTSTAYKDHATKAFIEGEEGSSSELGGASRAIAVMDLDDEETAVHIAREQTSLTHDEDVVNIADDLTRLAFRLKRGEPMIPAVKAEFEGTPELEQAQAVAGLEPNEAIGKLGRDCSLKSALPSLLYLLLRNKLYRESVIENVMAGGDSAARGLLLGALIAAAKGPKSVPEDWESALVVHQV